MRSTLLKSFNLGPSASTRMDFPGKNGGPLHITSSLNIIAAERIIYSEGGAQRGVETSYFELMAFPHNQLTTQYWIPWYNNVNMWTQLRFANPSTSQTAAVKIYLGTTLLKSFNLGPSGSTRMDFPGINGGPLKIASTQKIIAAERVIYSEGGVQRGVETSYSELMAVPHNQLDSAYVFPSYSYPDANTWGQIRVANPNAQNTNVSVYLGSEVLGTYPRGGNKSMRLDYVGRDGGPLKIVSSNVTIITSMRVIYSVGGVQTSYAEIPGYPVSRLTHTYLFPWYNNFNFDTELRISNP